MPWRETSPMDQRLRFIADYEKRLFSVSELCARFGVSRKTGYKWIERYQVEGPAGLLDRSRKPHTCAHQTPREIVDALLEARRRHHLGREEVAAHSLATAPGLGLAGA